MRSIPASFRLLAATAFAAGIASCSSSHAVDGGMVDSGPMDAGPMDAGPTCLCAGLTETCNATQGCCANLTCTGGVCTQTTAPSCVAIGNRCSASADCCGALDGGAGMFPNFTSCQLDGLGVGRCYIGGPGASCSATQGCEFPFSCNSGTCQLVASGNTCSGTGCHAGDQCTLGTSDPCTSSGLACGYGVCEPPQVFIPGSYLTEASICTPPGQGGCVGLSGGRASPTCGSYPYFNGGNPTYLSACVETCQQSPDDCSSITWDCLQIGTQKQCTSNFCYAADIPQTPNPPFNVANAISNLQTTGSAVSNHPSVLFKACGAGAGPNTYCLPKYDLDWQTTVGVCTRVGGTGAGGVGAACDPSLSRAGGSGLCAAGTLCYRGTCLKWCDINNLVRAGCDPGQACLNYGGPLPSSFSSTDTTGVCVNICDPFQPAAAGECQSTPTWTCDNPRAVCKPNLPAQDDSDVFPQTGMCVGGASSAIPVGQSCSTGQWIDPCVSGAACLPPPGGGNTKTCQQMCEPIPSASYTAPPCPSGQHCNPVPKDLCQNTDGGSCKTYGTCQ